MLKWKDWGCVAHFSKPSLYLRPICDFPEQPYLRPDQKFYTLFQTCLTISHAQYGAWVVKWAPFLRFSVTFVHANLCMHTFITFFVFVRHIEFFKKVPFFAKIELFSPIWYGVEVSISTLVHCKDCPRAGVRRNKVFLER